MAIIKKVAIYRVLLPLKEPYALSYGPVEALDSIFCEVHLEDGRLGWGESTPLPGYCPSTADQAWASTEMLASQAIGKPAEELKFQPENGDWFLTTALETAREEALFGSETYSGNVPLIGLVQGKSPAALLEQLNAQRNEGYQEFKVKVGVQNLASEISHLEALQSDLQDGEWLRLDANQGLDPDSAATLCAACEEGKVRFVEQPLPIESWQECARLAGDSPVPLCLDESIDEIGSIQKTAKMKAAGFIKLKWMKQGSATNLIAAVNCARDSGLKIIFGNGVSSSLNNRQESLFWLKHLEKDGLAGEMNGFAKVNHPVRGLKLERGQAVPEPMAGVPFNPGQVTRTVTFGP